MAQIFEFPKAADTEDAAIVAELANFFIVRGYTGTAARELARLVVKDFREFEAALAATTLSFSVANDGEESLVKAAIKQCADAVKKTWLVQRMISESRRP